MSTKQEDLKTLNERWDFFEASVVPESSCDAQRFLAKSAFFAGYAAMLSAFADAPETQDEFLSVMTGFHKEIEAFKSEAAMELLDRIFDHHMASTQ